MASKERKKVIATIEISGVENWNEFENLSDTESITKELKDLESEIQDELSNILGGRENISVKCNLILYK